MRSLWLTDRRNARRNAKSSLLSSALESCSIVGENLLLCEPLDPDPSRGGTHNAFTLALVRPACVDFPIGPMTVLSAGQKPYAWALKSLATEKGNAGVYFWDIIDAQLLASLVPATDANFNRSTVFTKSPIVDKVIVAPA